MDAAAIWLTRPQQFTLDSLDAFSAQKFNNKDIRRLRAELLKTETHLTRSARRLVQERNTKAAGVNIGLASPLMTATRFSLISVTSTMTDFYSTSTPANWPQNSTPLQTSASAPSSSEQQQPSHGPTRSNLPKLLKHSHWLHTGLRRWTPFLLTEDRRHYMPPPIDPGNNDELPP
jgi:hypothetical protein